MRRKFHRGRKTDRAAGVERLFVLLAFDYFPVYTRGVEEGAFLIINKRIKKTIFSFNVRVSLTLWLKTGTLTMFRPRKLEVLAMSSVVVVGTQWGDEGKGKITDFLSENAEVIARYQGGKQCRTHDRVQRGKV